MLLCGKHSILICMGGKKLKASQELSRVYLLGIRIIFVVTDCPDLPGADVTKGPKLVKVRYIEKSI